jgi:hypothetical protein
MRSLPALCSIGRCRYPSVCDVLDLDEQPSSRTAPAVEPGSFVEPVCFTTFGEPIEEGITAAHKRNHARVLFARGKCTRPSKPSVTAASPPAGADIRLTADAWVVAGQYLASTSELRHSSGAVAIEDAASPTSDEYLSP